MGFLKENASEDFEDLPSARFVLNGGWGVGRDSKAPQRRKRFSKTCHRFEGQRKIYEKNFSGALRKMGVLVLHHSIFTFSTVASLFSFSIGPHAGALGSYLVLHLFVLL